jgi:hypothetical protein
MKLERRQVGIAVLKLDEQPKEKFTHSAFHPIDGGLLFVTSSFGKLHLFDVNRCTSTKKRDHKPAVSFHL